MTEKNKEKIARSYRRLLDSGVLRKNAIEQTTRVHGITKMTLYRWMKRFNIPTK